MFVFQGMVLEIHNSYKVTYHGDDGEAVVIDFTPPFERVYLYPALEETLNVTLPSPTELDSPQAAKFLSDLCEQHAIECPSPRTAARLLDKVIIKLFLLKSIMSGLKPM